MTTKPMSRRNFLKLAGVTLAGAAACSGLGYAAVQQPQINTPQGAFGKENNMGNKVLVSYATRCGSTAEVAEAIAKTLAGRGASVDLKAVKDNPGLAGYTAVVLGSAIRMGSWVGEASDFVQANQAALNSLPTAIFSVHSNNLGEDETSRAARGEYHKAVRALITPAAEAFFAGKIDLAKMSFLDRLITKMMKAEEVDYRDWDKISAWAAGLPFAVEKAQAAGGTGIGPQRLFLLF